MKTSKNVIESIAVAALAMSMMITAITGDGVGTIQVDENVVANETAAVNTYDEAEDNVTVEEMDIELLTATGVGEITDEVTSGGTDDSTSTEMTEEEQKWQNKLMAQVDDYLYIRSKASSKSTIVGKLKKGASATIKKEGATWTKITSGKVTGYVKNSYCVTGSEAYEYAKEICDTVAKSTTDSLYVREEQSTESAVVKTVSTGDKLVVDTDADTDESWVAVKVDSDTCYVSAEYVTLSLNTGKAVTVKKSTKTSTKKSTSSSKKSSGYSATSEEEYLLAAIIQCEADGQSSKGMIAVGAVVLNRVKSSSFPNTIKKVIYQKGQFGPASSGKLARRLASGVSSSAKKAAKAALSGTDPTNGAKYFKMASSGHSGTVIGPVVFY